jgi:hypothetical protein
MKRRALAGLGAALMAGSVLAQPALAANDNAATKCADEYFAAIRKNFDTFTLPLVYTPGDNEWTDCHRTNNGAYGPLGRLDKVRETFFPKPGTTLGAR